MDIADLGNDEAQRQLDAILASRASNRSPERESAYECYQCAETIPQARREAVIGCTLCVDCAEIAERGKRRG